MILFLNDPLLSDNFGDFIFQEEIHMYVLVTWMPLECIFFQYLLVVRILVPLGNQENKICILYNNASFHSYRS